MYYSILILFVTCVSVIGSIQSEEQAAELPPLFDFENYEKIFGKHYEPLEEAARRAYFIPRALHVFTSAVSYRFRQSDYHLALNHMSDYLPVEIEMMYNNARNVSTLPGVVEGSKATRRAKSKLDDEVGIESISNEVLKQELEQLKEEAPMARDLLEAASNETKKRFKRSTDEEVASLPLRDLNLSDLISVHQEAKLPEGVKVKARVRSNNKNYQPLELDSQGIERKKLKLTEFRSLSAKFLDSETLFFIQRARMRKMIESDRIKKGMNEPIFDPDTKAFYILDHSRGKCMDVPRSQGQCGACYAFTAITIYEWLYCQKYGELVRFSEQYLIDCSKEYIKESSGCKGGNYMVGPDFVRNFGLELRANYPYREVARKCPLDQATTDLEKTGYVRFDAPTGIIIPYQLWEEYLHFGPLDVTIAAKNTDFLYYKRGIHTLTGCELGSMGLHAMVLVGHGTEDGKQFWKVRNSHGTNWGEKGYYRVLKDEEGECFKGPAIAYATANGRDFLLDKLKHTKGQSASEDTNSDGWALSLYNWFG